MILLGISSLDNESAASLVVDGRIVAAAAEERFTRVKQQGGFPHAAVEYVLREGGVRPQDVHRVAYPFFTWQRELALLGSAWLRDLAFTVRNGMPWDSRLVHLANNLRITFGTILRENDRMLAEGLARYGWGRRLRRVEHHLAHAASAWYTSGMDRGLVVTLDGYGSGAAGGFFLGEGKRLRPLARIPYPHSLGGFYWRITRALGFKPLRHEGKILGLAAYGWPDGADPLSCPNELAQRVWQRFDLSHPDHYRLRCAQDFRLDRQVVKDHTREEVSAAYQWCLERAAVDTVARWVDRTGCTRLAGAGGVFANVKMNQRLAEISGVEQLYVHPAMGDVGTGLGAALALAAQEDPAFEGEALRDAFLGPGFPEAEMEAALQGLAYERPADLAAQVAARLAQGEVVARFGGRMEYGPRALGNRTLLADTRDPSVNDWLNVRLRRSEFMPFAPATLAEHASKMFLGVERVAHAAEFMTVTLDCTRRMKELSPAAVHVDGTARPQLVRSDRHPELHAILTEYHRLTGIPSVVNTSYNLHEEPIVCSPRDAVKGFRESGLGWLAMGPFLARGTSPNGSARKTEPHGAQSSGYERPGH